MPVLFSFRAAKGERCMRNIILAVVMVLAGAGSAWPQSSEVPAPKPVPAFPPVWSLACVKMGDAVQRGSSGQQIRACYYVCPGKPMSLDIPANESCPVSPKPNLPANPQGTPSEPFLRNIATKAA